MSYGIVRIQKFTKGSVKGIEIHDRREKLTDETSHTNPDIDWDRSHLNYDLHPDQNQNFYQAVKNRINQLDLSRAVRKDAIVMAQVLVTSDHDFFECLTDDEQKKFFEDSYLFLADRYGMENIVSATVHLDEKTPHMHINMVPVTDDGRLSAKSVFTRASLINLQDRFHEQVGQEFGLDRGERGGKKKHLSVIDYKIATAAGELEQTEQSLEFGKKLVNEERTELDQLRAENQTLKSENNQSKKQLEAAQQELTDVKLAYDEMMAAGVEEYQKFKALENKNKLLEGRCSDLEKQIDEKISEANKIINQANRLESESEGQKLLISHLADQIRENSEKLNKVKVELSDAQNNVSEALRQEKLAQFRLEHLKADEKRLNGKIRDLEYAESRFPAEIRNLGQKKAGLEADLKILSDEKSGLQQENRNLKAENEKLYRFKSDRDNIVGMVDKIKDSLNDVVRQIERDYSKEVYIPRSTREWANKKPGLFKDNDRIHEAGKELRQLERQQEKQNEEKERKLNAVDRLKQQLDRQTEPVMSVGDEYEQEWDIWEPEQ